MSVEEDTDAERTAWRLGGHDALVALLLSGPRRPTTIECPACEGGGDRPDRATPALRGLFRCKTCFGTGQLQLVRHAEGGWGLTSWP